MATIPRTYKITSKDNIPNVPLQNGQIIAAYDSDEVWYDAPDTGAVGGTPVRRKISGVKVVSALPTEASEKVAGVLYVLTDTGKLLPRSILPVYEIYVWMEDPIGWILVGNNYEDENVISAKVEDTWLYGRSMYLTGSDFADTETGTLIKTPNLRVKYESWATPTGTTDTGLALHVPYVNGLAKGAVNTAFATNAEEAENDELGNKITGYVHGVSSDYNGEVESNPPSYTTVTVTRGDGESTTFKTRNTTYDVFTATTAGLVDSPQTTATLGGSYKILTSDGWANKGDIAIGTADSAMKAYNDVDSSRFISHYIADVSSSSGALMFTRGDSATPVSVPLSFNVFSTTADGLAPKANVANYNKKFLRGDAQWATLPEFDGTDPGVVPTTGASATKYLAGDGTWKGAFTGATAGAAGTPGLVPTPPSGDVYYVKKTPY